tara:strand:+ start:236 stop:352 length:117 start_codon:yes stop_codon:yes gene_type:complete
MAAQEAEVLLVVVEADIVLLLVVHQDQALLELVVQVQI